MASPPSNSNGQDDQRRSDYNFRTMRGVQRGKYAAKYQERLRLVRLADDVSGAFGDEQAVNDVLRSYLRQCATVSTS